MGGTKLSQHLCNLLLSQGKRPYNVPLGGSNALGSWGYLQAVQEMLEQFGKGTITDIVMVGQPLCAPAEPLYSYECLCDWLLWQPGNVFCCHHILSQACGSGGTTAGIALGNFLSGFGARVHAYGVCDDEEYFYNFIDGIFADLGATPDDLGALIRQLLQKCKCAH